MKCKIRQRRNYAVWLDLLRIIEMHQMANRFFVSLVEQKHICFRFHNRMNVVPMNVAVINDISNLKEISETGIKASHRLNFNLSREWRIVLMRRELFYLLAFSSF